MRVLQNKLRRKIFGSRRDEVTREWRKLHNEEFHNLCTTSNFTRVNKRRRMSWKGHVACTWEIRNVQGVLEGKPEGKIPLGRAGLEGSA